MKHNNIPSNLIEDLDTKEKYSSQAIIKFIIYLVIGIAATVLLLTIKDSKSSVYMFSAILSVVGYLLAVCTLIFSRKNTMLNGQKVNGLTLFFETSTANLQKAIDTKDKQAFKHYMKDTDNGLKLEVAYTDNGSLARYRMYRYIPFEFQPDSEVITINKDQLEFIKQA